MNTKVASHIAFKLDSCIMMFYYLGLHIWKGASLGNLLLNHMFHCTISNITEGKERHCNRKLQAPPQLLTGWFSLIETPASSTLHFITNPLNIGLYSSSPTLHRASSYWAFAQLIV